jgi:hypothetical protein
MSDEQDSFMLSAFGVDIGQFAQSAKEEGVALLDQVGQAGGQATSDLHKPDSPSPQPDESPQIRIPETLPAEPSESSLPAEQLGTDDGGGGATGNSDGAPSSNSGAPILLEGGDHGDAGEHHHPGALDRAFGLNPDRTFVEGVMEPFFGKPGDPGPLQIHDGDGNGMKLARVAGIVVSMPVWGTGVFLGAALDDINHVVGAVLPNSVEGAVTEEPEEPPTA